MIGDAHVLVDEVSVAATLEDLAVELARRGEASFRDLTVGAATTAHVVACFLALLELYKQELVDLDQTTTFGTLTVRWTGLPGQVPEVPEALREYGGADLERAP